MMLQLRRSADRERALERYIDELSDAASPNYHRWLNAEQLGRQYGLADQDLSTITSWLTSYGFAVNKIYSNRMVIDFSGTAGQVREAFHTEIHYLSVNGKPHIANMSDPQIPAALVAAVAGVFPLNDFKAQPQYRRQKSQYTTTFNGSTFYEVAPADLATIYNLKALFNASPSISGQGQTVVVIERTDIYSTSEFTTFRSTFLPSYNYSFTETHPGGCTDPGVVSGDEGEAILDAEWSSAAAPNAAIKFASCQSTSFGGISGAGGELIALMNLVDSSTPPAIMSSS
jgi:subtilase family serine protease